MTYRPKARYTSVMKKKGNTSSIVNRRARFDYELEQDFVVGIALSGRETKAIRLHHADLKGAFVTVRDEELWLTNATVTSTKNFIIPEDEQTRPRKLLASKKEIAQIMEARQQGRTVVPLALLTSGKYIKLKIAIAKGKKRYDKRQTIKKREQNIEAKRAVKHRSQ